MGSWGEGALENDLSMDAYGDFLDRFDSGADAAKLPWQLAGTYKECLLDPDSALDFWIGVAQAQWECGTLASEVAEEVLRLVAANAGLKGYGTESQLRRQTALAAFIQKIGVPAAKRRRRQKPAHPQPIFHPGDCLVAATLRGGYAPAIVLKVESTQRETYHLIASLRGVYPLPPPLEVYEQREWLYLTHNKWQNVLNMGWYSSSTYANHSRDLPITKVGTSVLRESDPTADMNTPGASYPSWGWIENQAWKQDEWDRRCAPQTGA